MQVEDTQRLERSINQIKFNVRFMVWRPYQGRPQCKLV
jgi:hypothetical protein